MVYPDTNSRVSSEDVLAGNPMRSSVVPILIRLAVSVVLIALASLRVRFVPSGSLRRICFFALLWVVPFLGIVGCEASGGLQKPHHLMMVYPFSLVVLALFVKLGLDMRDRLEGRLAGVLAAVAGIVFMCSGVVVDGRIFHYLVTDKPVDARWSSRLYELVEYIDTESTNADWIVSIDWGTHNALHALSTDSARRKMEDLWLPLKYMHRPINRAAAAELLKKLTEKRRTLVVAFYGENTVQELSRMNFEAVVRASGLAYPMIKEISQGDNVIYEIYEIRGTGQQSTPESTLPGATRDPQ